MTAHASGLDLAAANFFYRQPELYDQVQADPDHTVARQVEQFVDEHAPHATTLLDFGCGTGRDLEWLAGRSTVGGGHPASDGRVRPSSSAAPDHSGG